jgi:hypothetical protein
MLPTFVPTSEQTDKYRTMGATHTMEHRTIYGPIACFAVGLAFAAGVVMDQEDKNK